MNKAKVLIFDIETSPIIAHVWDIWDQNVALNQIDTDWHVLSWSAKWLGENKIMYMDQRNAPNIENDKNILKEIWKLLDEADVVITQNGIKFDVPKLNARFIMHGFQPPSPFRHIDVYRVGKKHFNFTSHKLEYMTGKLCKKYKKLKHKRYPGHELWKQVLLGNQDAWKEMEKYNKYDVLSLEELYEIMRPWDNTINFNIYHDDNEYVCDCGSTKFINKGYAYTETAKYRRYKCKQCGKASRSSVNLFSKDKKDSLRRKVIR